MSMHDPRTESRVKAERRPGGSADLTALPHIVLVHGAWADSSSWRAVIQHLQADGYRVTAPQFPLTRLADDVAPAAPGLGPPEGFRCMSSTRVGAHDLLGSTPSELAGQWLAHTPARRGLVGIGLVVKAGAWVPHLDLSPRGHPGQV